VALMESRHCRDIHFSTPKAADSSCQCLQRLASRRLPHVSTDDQRLDLQHDALVRAGVESDRIFNDKLSGIRADRPGLAAVLKAVREGDILVVWRLDRLGRSLKGVLGSNPRKFRNPGKSIA
jgi:hypothetical protein